MSSTPDGGLVASIADGSTGTPTPTSRTTAFEREVVRAVDSVDCTVAAAAEDLGQDPSKVSAALDGLVAKGLVRRWEYVGAVNGCRTHAGSVLHRLTPAGRTLAAGMVGAGPIEGAAGTPVPIPLADEEIPLARVDVRRDTRGFAEDVLAILSRKGRSTSLAVARTIDPDAGMGLQTRVSRVLSGLARQGAVSREKLASRLVTGSIPYVYSSPRAAASPEPRADSLPVDDGVREGYANGATSRGPDAPETGVPSASKAAGPGADGFGILPVPDGAPAADGADGTASDETSPDPDDAAAHEVSERVPPASREDVVATTTRPSVDGLDEAIGYAEPSYDPRPAGTGSYDTAGPVGRGDGGVAFGDASGVAEAATGGTHEETATAPDARPPADVTASVTRVVQATLGDPVPASVRAAPLPERGPRHEVIAMSSVVVPRPRRATDVPTRPFPTGPALSGADKTEFHRERALRGLDPLDHLRNPGSGPSGERPAPATGPAPLPSPEAVLEMASRQEGATLAQVVAELAPAADGRTRDAVSRMLEEMHAAGRLWAKRLPGTGEGPGPLAYSVRSKAAAQG